MAPTQQTVTLPSDGSLHIVLFPFPAQGHFTAFLSLAGHLHRAQPSAAITLVSTPGNVAALRSSSSTSAPFLQFHATQQQRSGHLDGDGDSIMRWLDGREQRSVLYISFGSQNSLRREQMMELAAALELTGRPFVWAIRPPVGYHDDDYNAGTLTVDRWLPEGFEEQVRANDAGLLVHGWAPQLSILAHASTGAFLSHCGWNSVLESVTHGVPIVGWPLAAEQFYNVKMLDEELGVCVEVARGNDEGSLLVERERLAEAVETVMGHDAKGMEIQRRAKEIQEFMRGAHGDGGSSMEALKEFFTRILRGTCANDC